MLKENGRVVAVDGESVWVETISRSACGSCSAKAGCGQSVLAKWAEKHSYLQLSLDGRASDSIRVNDQITIGIPDDSVVKSALLLYCVPLITLVLGASLGSSLIGGDVASVLGALMGVAMGGLFIALFSRLIQHRSSFSPVILDVHPSPSCAFHAT
ncbi:alginate biosynthesis regulator MucC [Aurantivibrio plasticivorans]